MRCKISVVYVYALGPATANWTIVHIQKQYINNELHLVINLEASPDIIPALIILNIC